MVLQIHDELLFDLPLGELSSLAGLVKDKMEKVLKLEVPVIVDIKKGHNWLEMSAYSQEARSHEDSNLRFRGSPFVKTGGLADVSGHYLWL
jgi:hypothetical protein